MTTDDGWRMPFFGRGRGGVAHGKMNGGEGVGVVVESERNGEKGLPRFGCCCCWLLF